jgi:hypothetical protein
MEEMGNSYKISEGKLEWKRPFGRPKCRWKSNIKIELR